MRLRLLRFLEIQIRRIKMKRDVRLNVKKIVTGLFLLLFSFQFAFSRPEPGEMEYRSLPDKGLKYEALLNRALTEGFVNVIARLRVEDIEGLTRESNNFGVKKPLTDWPIEGVLADSKLMDAINNVTKAVLSQLNGVPYRIRYTYSSIPYLSLEASPEALEILTNLSEVIDVEEVTKLESERDIPEMDRSQADNDISTIQTVSSHNMLIGADQAWGMGYTGSGWYVAILDSGIDTTDAWFLGKDIVEVDCGGLGEDCTVCAGCAFSITDHGNIVAKRAVGNKDSNNRGVAYESDIIAILTIDPAGDTFIKALEWLYINRQNYPISAINVSRGTTFSYSEVNCDQATNYAPILAISQNLFNADIPVVIASGNDGLCDETRFPACILTAISVGATLDDYLQETDVSNWHPYIIDFFAPGGGGTSYAAPIVSGAWTLIREAAQSLNQNFDILEYYNAFADSGLQIDRRCTNGEGKPFIRVDHAIHELLIDFEMLTPQTVDEDWILGSLKEIRWDTMGFGNVKLELLQDCHKGECIVVGTIIDSIANDGSYMWCVGDCEGFTAEAGYHYFIKISSKEDPSKSDISVNFFNITEPISSVTVTSPDGGEQWELSSWHDITWNSENLGGNVGIMLVKNGADLGYIIGETANDGVYNWQVGQYLAGTAAAADDYRVKVVSIDNGDVFDTSDQDFSITQPSASYITVTQPAAGAIWEKNLAYEIRWTSSADIPAGSNVSIKLMKNGTYVGLITGSTPNSGTYNWTVPADIDGNELFGSGYQVRIKSLSTLVEGYSGSFTIKGIRLTSPNGGESWPLGFVRNITWDAPGITDTVKITLWKDGLKVGDVAWVDPAPGSYAWTVGQYDGGTASPGSGYMIKVKEILTNNSDFSDAPFTIADSQPEPVTYTLYPTTVPSVADWIQESYIIGEYDGNKAEGTPTGTTYLVATGFDTWTLPAGKVITKVEYGVLARFTDGVRGKARMREFSHSEAERWLTFGLAWEWTDFDITALETSWTQAEVNALQVGIRRAYVDDPDANLRVGGIRLKVTVE